MVHEIDDSKITRVEIINHAENYKTKGRLLTLLKELDHFDSIDISIQDSQRTIKIFLNSNIKD
jgi:hypothetical protein